MRLKRGVAVVAIALAGALAMTSCAKGGDDDSDSGAPSGQKCRTAEDLTPPPSSTAPGETIDASAMKVGLAFDIGGRGDASFNDAAAAGLDKMVSEAGLKKENTKELTATDQEAESAKQTRLQQLADEGYNPVVAIGFAYSDATVAIAKKYPDTKFAVVDGFAENAPKNVTFLGFAEQEGSFLVGVVAALKSKSGTVGFVGGVNVPLIQKFEAGFTQGVKAAKPDTKVVKKYITQAGDLTGFTDPAKGQAAAEGLINQGADVVYHGAGASGKGVFAAAHSAGIMAIGVDSDQFNQKSVAEYKDVIITSMLKRVDVAVFDYITATATDKLADLPPVFDLKVDGVGYSTSGGKIDDIVPEVDKYKQEIIDGKVIVQDKPSCVKS